MNTFTVLSICTYPGTELWPYRNSFSDETWTAKKFVDALKGKTINGYGWVPTPSGRRWKLQEATKDKAFDAFARLAAPHITYPNRKKLIVPLPSSSATSASLVERGRTHRMAEALARHLNAEVEALLWWSTSMQKAHQGGPRYPDKLYPYLEVGETVHDRRPVILVDDVKTTGGHLRTAEAALWTEAEQELEVAVCAGRTVEEEEDEPFSLSLEELECYEP